MPFDNRTILFSLMIVSALMALSMFAVSRPGERNGLRKWAAAMALESVSWLLIALRGISPDLISIVLANVLLAAAQAAKLAAIHEYRQRDWPLRECLLPVLAIAVAFIALQDDLRGRIIYGSLIYGAQVLLIAIALRGDLESRSGRAWWLLFGSTIAFLPLLALRALVALLGQMQFALPENSLAPNPLQLLIFVFLMALGIMGSMGFILMIKERADREIRSLAMIDSLTGVYNRRAFMERAQKEWSVATRNGLPLSLLMIDIDHFKAINDGYGHPAGDTVLAAVARDLARRLRKQDTIGRYGGEEFAILLPGTDAGGAKALGQTLCRAVEAGLIPVSGKTVCATVSIGIAACPASGVERPANFEQLLENADAALYQAKREGRNRIVELAPGSADPAAALVKLAEAD